MKTDYKFGDPIWICLEKGNDIEAIFIRKSFGCAIVVTESSSTSALHVAFDLIKPRKIIVDCEHQWIPFPLQQPKCDTPYIVSIRDDSGDHVRRYTSVGWRSSSFLQENAWIVDDEVNCNVEAWMPMPEPFTYKNERLNI